MPSSHCQIEDDIDSYEDDRFETKEDIIEDVKETFDKVDSFYDDYNEEQNQRYYDNKRIKTGSG